MLAQGTEGGGKFRQRISLPFNFVLYFLAKILRIKRIRTCYIKKPKLIFNSKNLESLVVSASVFMRKHMVTSIRAIK